MCIFCNKSQKGLSVAAGHNVELSDFFSGEPTAGADIERRETRPSTLQNPAREAEYHHRRSSTVSTREHRARASSSSSSPNPASHARRTSAPRHRPSRDPDDGCGERVVHRAPASRVLRGTRGAPRLGQQPAQPQTHQSGAGESPPPRPSPRHPPTTTAL